MKKLAFAMYKPREGKAEELMDILKIHIPTLKEYDLITDKEPFTVLSENGTVIEIFEWASQEAIDLAHEHPAIRTIWGKMGPICDFVSMKDLPESQNAFPSFDILS
ncbi:MAG TPA: hypothetical protein VEB40_05575 [Flavipsychrobacter sp.]|nr:hypothetical protein [Flavipsychrobacter sp.]